MKNERSIVKTAGTFQKFLAVGGGSGLTFFPAQQTLRTKPENLVQVPKTCGDFDVVVTSVKTFN
jgi:hypothetical protein